jgi:ABC-2 type transport system permease protein
MGKPSALRRAALKKYEKSFSLGLQSALEYRWNFAFGFLTFAFTLTMEYFTWTGIFHSAKSAIVYGYTYPQMLIYSLFAALVSKFVSGGFEYGMLDDVKNGGLSKFIIKPIGYLRYRFSCFLGERAFYAAIIFILIGVFIGVFYTLFGYTVSAVTALLFLLSVLLSLLMNFFIYSALAALSFWMTDAWAVFVVFGLVANVFSGGVFPLDIFGPMFNRILGFLPFQYTIYFPVNILSGRIFGSGILFGLFMQLVWVSVLFCATNLLWRIGLKKYVAVGG